MLLTIRADADDALGAGHAARCLALAEAWRDAGHGPIRWVGRVQQPFLRERLAALTVAPEPNLFAPEAADAGPLVLDVPDPAARDVLYSAPHRPRVCVDDSAGDVPGATEIAWVPHVLVPPRERYAAPRLLAGPDHLAVRADLPPWAPDPTGTVGVMIGGGAVADRVRVALAAALAAEPRVIATGGAAQPGWASAPGAAPWHLLARCARVVIGAGTTVYEAAAVGAPVVALVVVGNQVPLAGWLTAHGVPVVDARTPDDPTTLARAIRAALPHAAPPPPLRSGLATVVAAIRAWPAR